MPGIENGDNEAGHTMSRADVARRLNMSVSSIRRLEFDKLHPVQDERGAWRFDPMEVEAIASTNLRQRQRSRRPHQHAKDPRRTCAREGRIAATVFRMFARYMTLPQIVVATRQPPDLIRELYREWSTALEEGEWERRDRAEGQ